MPPPSVRAFHIRPGSARAAHRGARWKSSLAAGRFLQRSWRTATFRSRRPASKSIRASPTCGRRHIHTRCSFRPTSGEFILPNILRHEVLVAAIPCTSHSMLGRAKKSLGQKPELGDSGDLFLTIASLIATHLPLACVFENVPSFGTSLAGLSLSHHLRQIGLSRDRDRSRSARRMERAARPPPLAHGGHASAPAFVVHVARPTHIAGDLSDYPRFTERTRPRGCGAASRAASPRCVATASAISALGRGYRILDDLSQVPTSAHTGPLVPQDQRRAIPLKPLTVCGCCASTEVEKLMGCTIDCEALTPRRLRSSGKECRPASSANVLDPTGGLPVRRPPLKGYSGTAENCTDHRTAQRTGRR